MENFLQQSFLRKVQGHEEKRSVNNGKVVIQFFSDSESEILLNTGEIYTRNKTYN